VGIDIPHNPIDDSICWGLNSSGEFSTKSATWTTHKSQPLQKTDRQYKWIWKLNIMPKIYPLETLP